MAKAYRPVVGVEADTKQVKQWDSAYACAIELGVAIPAITQALNRNGECKRWRLYDSPEYYERRIDELKAKVKEVEKILAR